MRPRHARFVGTRRTVHGRTVRLGYALVGGPDPDRHFEERITLPEAAHEGPATDAALRLLHGLAGVSYYKAALPDRVELDLPEAEARLVQRTWHHGLGEFWFRNGLEPGGRPRIDGGIPAPGATTATPRTDRALLLVGGGKDSAVSRELLRAMGVAVDLFSVGRAPWIARQAAAMGDAHLVATRHIDPALLELNDAGAWNGHVPVTAIVLAIAWLAALRSGHRWIVASNERSADVGNTTWHGLDVNHQWSKGADFEHRFAAVTQALVPGGPLPFSLLRPLSEAHIGALLARTTRYDDAMTSCNANFRHAPGAEPARWCGRCPKCLFVFVVVGAHVDATRRARIFGADFLADAGNEPLLAALAGEAQIKPFECVGTPEELSAALGRWPEPLPPAARGVAERLAARIAPGPAWLAAATPSNEHHLPAGWEERLRAAVAA